MSKSKEITPIPDPTPEPQAPTPEPVAPTPIMGIQAPIKSRDDSAILKSFSDLGAEFKRLSEKVDSVLKPKEIIPDPTPEPPKPEPKKAKIFDELGF